MGAALSIAVKDLKLRVRDRSVLVIGLLAPLVLSFIFNLVFGSNLAGPAASFHPSYGLVDEDRGAVAAAFVDVLRRIEGDGFFDLEPDLDRDRAEQALEDDELDSAFVIPAGLTAAVLRGHAATIEVIGNVDSPTSSQVARSIAQRFANEVRRTQLSVGTWNTLVPAPPEELPAVAAEAAATPPAVSVGLFEAATRQLDATTFFAAGMAVFFLFFTVQFGVSGLLEERQQGTLARLLAAPIGRWSVIAGKAITSLALGVTSLAVLMVASRLLMGADWGDPLAAGLLVVAGALSAVGIMGVVAAMAKTPEQAGNIASIVAVTLGMLGGSFFPVGQGGGVLSRLTFLTPHAWFLRGLADLAGGGGVGVVLPALAALLGIAAVTAGVALVLLRRGLPR